MPSIVPPSTDTQARARLHQVEDWQPPCEYSIHVGDRPASWILILKHPPCGHQPVGRILFMCPRCLSRRLTGVTYCLDCSAVFPCMANVVRVEPL